MKLGILTLTPLLTNYGGILQTYAMQRVLERMGHEVYTVNPQEQFPFCVNPVRLVWRMGKSCYNTFTRYIRSLHTLYFINEHIHVLPIKDFDQLNHLGFEGYVVGSDQVWRPCYWCATAPIEQAFLAFAQKEKVKRVAYAASFGTDVWEYWPEATANCEQLAQKFDAISVREASGIVLCREHLKVEARHVLDPTMLLQREDYLALICEEKTKACRGSLMTYILDCTPEKAEVIRQIERLKKLKAFSTNSRADDERAPLHQRVQPAVEQWLRSFRDCQFVITGSFHACVFSILFGKEFLVIGNKKRGMGRFYSLLRIFGLDDRLVDPTNFDYARLKPIDWADINTRLEQLRTTSKDFIQSALKES